MDEGESAEKSLLNKERLQVLKQLEEWLEVPMLALGFVWLILLVVEVVWGLSRFLETVSTVIWIIFILDFVLRFAFAPRKLHYLKTNWLTAVSLVAPALRLLRIVQLARLLRLTRVTRGLRLLRIISSLNRGMRALSTAMRKRGFGYVVALSLIIALVGAAGMLAFEGDSTQVGNGNAQGIHSYGDALWWTAMALTTMGSDYSPITPEGRVLGFVLALYAFAVFGYVTATLATFFVGRDVQGEISGSTELEAVRQELGSLKREIGSLRETLSTVQTD